MKLNIESSLHSCETDTAFFNSNLADIPTSFEDFSLRLRVFLDTLNIKSSGNSKHEDNDQICITIIFRRIDRLNLIDSKFMIQLLSLSEVCITIIMIHNV